MANDRYSMVCDVPQGTTPSEATCEVSYEPRTDAQLFPPLTVEEGALIATAIMGCWAVAFGFKQVMKHLQSS